MFCLTADNAYYTQYGSQYVISTPNAGVRLKAQSNNDILNSIKVLNIFKNSLSNIDQYNNAEIHRRGEAVTLQLQSYSWNFDIVPCFFTDTQLYLIPDGNGHWKATNPKVDQECITAINLDNEGKALQLIRTLKYWNRHHSSHTLNSYLFEQFVLNFINSKTSLSDFIDFSIRDFFSYLYAAIFQPVNDPKSLQGDLNKISILDRLSISTKASWAYKKAYDAFQAEAEESNQAKAIRLWQEIFGTEFPNYG